MTVRPDIRFTDESIDLEATELYSDCRLSFGLATMLPRSAYVSDVFQKLECEKVWTRAWVYVGTTQDISNVGDLLPYTIGQHAVHVQRQQDGELVGRFNKAQHGGCRSVPAQCRTGRKTKCSYTSCGHSRDQGAILSESLGEMSPLMGQYLGVIPERLLPVRIIVAGDYILANINPTHADGEDPPSMPFKPSKGRQDGLWLEYRSNWKLAGACLVDVARTDADGGALNHVEAEWHFPNLVIIRSRSATAAVILQPTAMNQTLWRISLFATAESPNFDDGRKRLLQFLERAGERAITTQEMVEKAPVDVTVESTRAGWRFNQQLIYHVVRQHSAYWNAPLVDATAMVSS